MSWASKVVLALITLPACSNHGALERGDGGGAWDGGGFKFVDDYGVRDFGDPDARARWDAGFSAERFCNNRLDEDEDGLTDCEDPDCAGDIHCFRGDPLCSPPREEVNPFCRNDPEMPCDGRRECVNLSSSGALNPVRRCMYPCEREEDCSDLPCSDPRCVVLPGAETSKVCVAKVVSEGEIGDLGASVPTFCAPGLVAYPGLLSGLNDGEFSCVRPCSTSADCTLRAPICDVNTQPSDDPNAPAGVCVSQIRGAGAHCSELSGLNTCSLNQAEHGKLVCYAPGLGYPRVAFLEGWGVCSQVCGRGLEGIPENCSNRHNPTGTSTCTFSVVFDSEELGFCDDRCSNHPQSCGGPGWKPTQSGQVCTQLQVTSGGNQDYDLPDLSYCVDRSAQELELWSPTSGSPPTPDQDCFRRPFNCPRDTFCMRLVSRIAGCVRGCSTTATVSGCAQGPPGTTCRSLASLGEEHPNLIPSDPSADESGLCAP